MESSEEEGVGNPSPSNVMDSGDEGDMGIQYIQFIYQDNVKLQKDISDCTDQMLHVDRDFAKAKGLWEEEIEELERQIKLY